MLQIKVDREDLPGQGRPVPRGQHPKHHGCVSATFAIASDVPQQSRVGVFRDPGRQFPAWIRYSNARVLDDRKPGGHGMAVKLMDVEGEKLQDGEQHARTQDFVLLDSPVFFIKDAIEYAAFEAALVRKASNGSFLGSLPLLWYFATHLRELGILRRIARSLPSNPLESHYWSATPYKLGAGAVKYYARPCVAGPPIAAPVRSPDQLREAMKRNLQTRDASFDFFVQPQVDPVRTPIEDPTRAWDVKLAPYRKVATIHIPRQDFDGEEQMRFCENLSFNPWHALPDHRPLGGINRVRRTVYEALSDMRRKLNDVPLQEPTLETSHSG